MNSTERPVFEDRCKVLLAGFNTMVTPERLEAYWTGLNRMPLGTFERCLSHVLGPEAPDRLPTPGQLWRVSKELRAKPDARSTAPVQPQGETFANYGNRAMVAWLCKRGPASATALLDMVDEKNRLCDAYRVICQEEPTACVELRDKLFAAWEAAWQPLSTEIAAKPSPIEPATPAPLSIADLAHMPWASENPFHSEEFANQEAS